MDGDLDLVVLIYDSIERRMWLGLNQGNIRVGEAVDFKQSNSVFRPNLHLLEYVVLEVGDNDTDVQVDELLLERAYSYVPGGRL